MKRENLRCLVHLAKACLLSMMFCSISSAQNIQRVQRTIRTLASPNFHGRGYVSFGDSIAAVFIKNQLDSLGLTPLATTGYQRFKLDVNTFPSELSLQIGSKKLVPGKDFIVAPNSGSAKGKFNMLFCDSSVLVSLPPNKINKRTAIILDPSAQRTLKKQPDLLKTITLAGLRLEIKPKLTASLAQNSTHHATLWVLENEIFRTKKSLTCGIKNEVIKDYTTKNIVYKIDGTIQTDSFLVITAHYDHLGRMGPSVYFPGANDNASGIAFLLEMADYFKKNPPKYTVVFIAFAAEEIGLLGSEYFVNHPLIPLENIKFLVNLDLVGTGDDGIQVVNSTIFTKEFARLKSINDQENYFQTVKTRGKAANSDHYHFSEKGVPSFFIYALGGITAYHDINDTSEKLPLTKFKELFQLTLKFLNSF